MRLREYQVEVENGKRSAGPGEPSESPQNAVTGEESEPFVESRVGIQPMTQDEQHAEPGRQMGAERENGRTPKPLQISSTTSLNPRRSHSCSSCSRDSQSA